MIVQEPRIWPRRLNVPRIEIEDVKLLNDLILLLCFQNILSELLKLSQSLKNSLICFTTASGASSGT